MINGFNLHGEVVASRCAVRDRGRDENENVENNVNTKVRLNVKYT